RRFHLDLLDRSVAPLRAGRWPIFGRFSSREFHRLPLVSRTLANTVFPPFSQVFQVWPPFSSKQRTCGRVGASGRARARRRSSSPQASQTGGAVSGRSAHVLIIRQ